MVSKAHQLPTFCEYKFNVVYGRGNITAITLCKNTKH